ncbi:MAG: COX15/CtaA family protein [Oligoflexia bacterium]|nr:COX15/CtaA family protein [Oligoflexia bacterium]
MKNSRALVAWLVGICVLILAIVAVGGVTRLTHSGLSIVEWKPVTGVIPPLTETHWQAEFTKYQQFPEYRTVNHGMTLAEFKFIFFWEYLHRLLGRLAGLAAFLPLAFHWRRLQRGMAFRLAGGLVLIGLQGVLGWFMVQSGLVENPRVSHFRLAAHLSLALGVLVYYFWLILDLWDLRDLRDLASEGSPRGEGALAPVRRALWGFTGIVFLQIVYGAFTAGLRAGFGFNTFPKMNEEWVPTGFLSMESMWADLLHNPVTVQFVHRWLGIGVLCGALVLGIASRKVLLTSRERWGIRGVVGLTALQVLLGIGTLLWVVPLGLAVLHQLVACFLLLAAINLNHCNRSTRSVSEASAASDDV